MHPQRTNIPLQGLDGRALTVGALSSPHSPIKSPRPSWTPLLMPFHQSWIYMVGKKHLGKVDQLTLARGGSEHA